MMGEFIAWLVEGFAWWSLGAFVAWHVPQPVWAKWVQDKVVAGYKWSKAKYDAR